MLEFRNVFSGFIGGVGVILPDRVGVQRVAGSGGFGGDFPRDAGWNVFGAGVHFGRFGWQHDLFRLVGDGGWRDFVRVAGVVFHCAVVRRGVFDFSGGQDVLGRRRFGGGGGATNCGGRVSGEFAFDFGESEGDNFLHCIFAFVFGPEKVGGGADSCFGVGVFHCGGAGVAGIRGGGAEVGAVAGKEI